VIEPRLGGGERRISLSSPPSRRSSTWFFRFLVLYTGGGAVSGDCTGGVGCGAGTAARGTVEGVFRARAAGAAVAALPRLQWRRWRRRRLPAAAEVSAGTGKLQETVNVWRPAAWLNTTRAFKPQAKHLSYSAVNSAAMKAGCCAGLEDFGAHAPSPRTMLAHVGARGELWRRGWVSWQVAGAAGSLVTPQVGEARWRGARQGDRTVACIPPPAPAQGGEEGVRSSVRVGRGEPSLTKVSSGLTKVSSGLAKVSSGLILLDVNPFYLSSPGILVYKVQYRGLS
jgi:hypothetical protein